MKDKVIRDLPLDHLCPGEGREFQLGKESVTPFTHSRTLHLETTAAPWCLFSSGSRATQRIPQQIQYTVYYSLLLYSFYMSSF